MSSKDLGYACLIWNIAIPAKAIKEWIGIFEVCVDGWAEILRQLRVRCVLSCYATDARAWMHDPHDTMMHLFWCSCSGSQAWVGRQRKNGSFDSDSDHLDWLAQPGLGPHWYTPTLFWWSPCKHTVTTNMQCCQYHSTATKQKLRDRGEIGHTGRQKEAAFW